MEENKVGDFEKNVAELEAIVDSLNKESDLSLEQSLQFYEKGIRIASKCEKMLNEAEQKIKDLQNQMEKEAEEGVE